MESCSPLAPLRIQRIQSKYRRKYRVTHLQSRINAFHTHPSLSNSLLIRLATEPILQYPAPGLCVAHARLGARSSPRRNKGKVKDTARWTLARSSECVWFFKVCTVCPPAKCISSASWPQPSPLPHRHDVNRLGRNMQPQQRARSACGTMTTRQSTSTLNTKALKRWWPCELASCCKVSCHVK